MNSGSGEGGSEYHLTLSYQFPLWVSDLWSTGESPGEVLTVCGCVQLVIVGPK